MTANPSCPSWCIADHAAEDEPGDVRHRGEVAVVPAVVVERGEPGTAELLVELSAAVGRPGPWVYVGDGWSGFSLDLDSARRLHAGLGRVLASAD